MTLVGRGPNFNSYGAIIPTFKDSEGVLHYLCSDGDDASIFTLERGVLTYTGDDIQIPVGEFGSYIEVNRPDRVNNSPNALLFAKACGLEVSLVNLILRGETNPAALSNAAPFCANGAFVLTSSDGIECCAYCNEGWGIGEPGYVGCNFEPVENYVYDAAYECATPSYLHNDDLSFRQQAHNACIFMLAGVPASVFELGE